MKTLLLASIFTLGSLSGVAQKILIGAQTELTVAGNQYGGSLLYETNKRWSYGGFYQTSLPKPAELISPNFLYGIQVMAPLVSTEKISFLASMRGGLANNKFIVFIPGVETQLSMGSRLRLAVGMSMRMNYPAISSRLIIKLF